MKNLLIVVTMCTIAASVFADAPKVERRKSLTANVGVVSVGRDTYWKQCKGLHEDMVKTEDV